MQQELAEIQHSLVIAAQQCEVTAIEQLLAVSQKFGGFMREGQSAALYIAVYMNHPRIAGLLLQAGANPNYIHPRHGDSPLHLAAKEGYSDVVELLLQHHANPNLKSEQGVTPLHLAATHQHTRVVKMLLAKFADARVKNTEDGATALHAAVTNNNTDITTLLLLHGAKADEADQLGTTPLQIAATLNHLLLADILTQHGANPNLPNRLTNITALKIAAQKQHDAMTHLLIRSVLQSISSHDRQMYG